jgi:hypothetical protein
MATRRSPGKKKIKSGERDLEKGVLGQRGYNIFRGTKDIYQGEKANRKARKK